MSVNAKHSKKKDKCHKHYHKIKKCMFMKIQAMLVIMIMFMLSAHNGNVLRNGIMIMIYVTNDRITSILMYKSGYDNAFSSYIFVPHFRVIYLIFMMRYMPQQLFNTTTQLTMCTTTAARNATIFKLSGDRALALSSLCCDASTLSCNDRRILNIIIRYS